MCTILLEPERPQMTTQRMSFSHWITKATSPSLEYVTLISFPRQQWLRERASLLRYTCIASLVGTY